MQFFMLWVIFGSPDALLASRDCILITDFKSNNPQQSFPKDDSKSMFSFLSVFHSQSIISLTSDWRLSEEVYFFTIVHGCFILLSENHNVPYKNYWHSHKAPYKYEHSCFKFYSYVNHILKEPPNRWIGQCRINCCKKIYEAVGMQNEEIAWQRT